MSHKDLFQDRAWRDYAERFRKDGLPKIMASGVMLSIYSGDGSDFDVRHSVCGEGHQPLPRLLGSSCGLRLGVEVAQVVRLTVRNDAHQPLAVGFIPRYPPVWRRRTTTTGHVLRLLLLSDDTQVAPTVVEGMPRYVVSRAWISPHQGKDLTMQEDLCLGAAPAPLTNPALGVRSIPCHVQTPSPEAYPGGVCRVNKGPTDNRVESVPQRDRRYFAAHEVGNWSSSALSSADTRAECQPKNLRGIPREATAACKTGTLNLRHVDPPVVRGASPARLNHGAGVFLQYTAHASATELGAMLLLDKPLIVVSVPGVRVPSRLARAADILIENWSPSNHEAQERLTDAITAFSKEGS